MLEYQLLAHLSTPLRPKFLHCPYHGECANPANDTQYGEEPSISNSLDKGLCDNTSDAAKDVSHKIVHCHSAATSLGKELGQPVQVSAIFASCTNKIAYGRRL